ncbi:MAG: ATP-binding cassette domain-containing protein [Lachnospiraceae bacterium]|nr:ATP-binding cassette domain-containing protein [Lachnospiraceae bacterium]
MNNIRIPKKQGVSKVPLITQLEYRECGAACLSMIAAYYDKWVPLEQTRVDCGVARHGVSAGNIVRAARSYGFEAKGYSLTTEALSGRVSFPCIIHWEMKHFVVLCGFRGGHAIINSPARGRLRIPLSEFNEKFTGVVLDITPGADFEPSGSPKSILSFAKKRLAGMGTVIALLLLVMVLNSIFGFINPRMTQSFLDRLLSARDNPYLSTFIMIMAALAASQVILSLANCIYRLRIEKSIALSGNASFMKKLLYVPQRFYSQRLAGDLLMRKGTNASISLSLVSTIAPLFISTAMMVFYLFVMIYHSPMLTVIGLFSVALDLFLSRVIAQKRIDYNRMYMNDTSVYSSTTITGLEMMESIRSSGGEEGFYSSWENIRDMRYDGKKRYLAADAGLSFFPALLSGVTNYVVMILGVYLTIKGEFTLGIMTAFSGYLGSFMNPADTLISSGQRLSEMRTDMDRVEDVMEYPDDPVAIAPSAEDVTLSGQIDIRGVTFGYSRFEEPVIRTLDLHVDAGSLVVITGASGCGKTTLLRLMTGTYIPWEGTIFYDKKSITEIGHSAFTKNVAIVDQDIRLFTDTVKNNLKMWNEDITDEDMIAACRDAAIYDHIMERGGFEAMLFSEEYSGGQRQRLEIARAMCVNPQILILDEATANLDAKTEARILAAIKKRGITCIMVTHRPIDNCDRKVKILRAVVDT